MLTAGAISLIGIILGTSLVAVAIAGEVTDCQTRVERAGPGDLTYWSWRTIEGKQCWYRGDRWKPKHELRWPETIRTAASSAVGQAETDGRTELAGVDDAPTPPRTDGPSELTGRDAGPIRAATSIDNAPEVWRAKFADLLLANTCCWPELELTDFQLTGNVELGDARPDVRPAQPLWPILFLPLALLTTWHLVRGGRVVAATRGAR
jgi:hypothetical protein